MVLVVELDAVLDALLVERLQDHVAGPVGGEAGPLDRPLAEVAGVAAEPALVDLAVGRPVERQAHVLELDHGLDRLAGQDLGGVLVDEVVAALDRVEHVPLPVVLLLVAQGGTDAALGGAGVGAGRVELGQDGRVDAGLGELERRPTGRRRRRRRSSASWSSGSSPWSRRPGDGQRQRPRSCPSRTARWRQQVEAPSSAPVRTPPLRVVADDGPHAQERVEHHERQQQPVEGRARTMLAPAVAGDPVGVLAAPGRTGSAGSGSARARARTAPRPVSRMQVPDGELEAAALRPRPSRIAVTRGIRRPRT